MRVLYANCPHMSTHRGTYGLAVHLLLCVLCKSRQTEPQLSLTHYANADTHLPWINAGGHRVPTVICTHKASTYTRMCTSWDAHTHNRHKYTPFSSAWPVEFFSSFSPHSHSFMPVRYIRATAYVSWCFFISMSWEECSRAHAWMSPMFSSRRQLVMQVFSLL